MVAVLSRALLVGVLALGAVLTTAADLWTPVPLVAADEPDAPALTGGPVLAPPPAPPAPLAKAVPPAKPVARVLLRTDRPRRTAAQPGVRETRQAYADRRGRAALASLGYPTERLGYTIVFRPYTGGVLGRADGRARVVTLFVKPGQSELSLRVTLAHEIGHVVDYLTSTSASRRDYLAARGISPRAWFPCSGCSDYASPAGDFAEVFALWLAGPGDFRSRLAGPPARAQLHELGLRFFQPPR